MFKLKHRRAFSVCLCNLSADVMPSGGLKFWGTPARAVQGFSVAWIIPETHVWLHVYLPSIWRACSWWHFYLLR